MNKVVNSVTSLGNAVSCSVNSRNSENSYFLYAARFIKCCFFYFYFAWTGRNKEIAYPYPRLNLQIIKRLPCKMRKPHFYFVTKGRS